MYKQIHESIKGSDKLNSISDAALRVWLFALAQSDSYGRYEGSAKKIKALAMPLYECSDKRVDEAITELSRQDIGLIHVYLADNKPFIVFHDHDQHNKGLSNLRYRKPDYPTPPSGLCKCVKFDPSEKQEEAVERRSDGVTTAVALVQAQGLFSGSSFEEKTIYLCQVSRACKMIGHPLAVQNVITGAIVQGRNAGEVEKWIRDNAGHDINEMRAWLKAPVRRKTEREMIGASREAQAAWLTEEYKDSPPYENAFIGHEVWLREGNKWVFSPTRTAERLTAIKEQEKQNATA